LEARLGCDLADGLMAAEEQDPGLLDARLGHISMKGQPGEPAKQAAEIGPLQVQGLGDLTIGEPFAQVQPHELLGLANTGRVGGRARRRLVTQAFDKQPGQHIQEPGGAAQLLDR